MSTDRSLACLNRLLTHSLHAATPPIEWLGAPSFHLVLVPALHGLTASSYPQVCSARASPLWFTRASRLPSSSCWSSSRRRTGASSLATSSAGRALAPPKAPAPPPPSRASLPTLPSPSCSCTTLCALSCVIVPTPATRVSLFLPSAGPARARRGRSLAASWAVEDLFPRQTCCNTARSTLLACRRPTALSRLSISSRRDASMRASRPP